MTRRNCVRTKLSYCIGPWLISLLLCLAPLLLDALDTTTTTTTTNSTNTSSASTYDCVLFNTPIFVVVSSFFSFYLPLLIISVLYARVFIKISQQSKRFRMSRKSKKTTTTTILTLTRSEADPIKSKKKIFIAKYRFSTV